MSRDETLVRNAVAILLALDKHEIEPIADADWISFQDDPHRQFLKLSTEARDRVWTAIQRRLPVELQEVA